MQNLSQPPDLNYPKLSTTSNPSRAMIGAGLVVIGLIILAGTLLQSEVLGLLVLPAIGVMFLVAGVLSRSFGFFIPGGILTGLGIAVFAQQEFMQRASADARGGIIVMGLSAGFMAILPLCWYFAGKLLYWPLIPGGFLLIVGLCLFIGGGAIQVLNFLGVYFWPVLLVAVGGYLLFRSRPPTHHPHRHVEHLRG